MSIERAMQTHTLRLKQLIRPSQCSSCEQGTDDNDEEMEFIINFVVQTL